MKLDMFLCFMFLFAVWPWPCTNYTLFLKYNQSKVLINLFQIKFWTELENKRLCVKAHGRIFCALLGKWNVTSGDWRHHIVSWPENPLTSKNHCTNFFFFFFFLYYLRYMLHDLHLYLLLTQYLHYINLHYIRYILQYHNTSQMEL